MKRLLALILTALLLCASCALAEDYASLTVEELTAMRNAINAELAARTEAVKAEAVQAFTSADQFIYVDNGEEVMIRGYSGTEGDVVIPSEIAGLPVTRIAESAFKENNTLRSVIIPDSVVEIGANAFYSCKSLQKVVLSKNVTEIKDNTFAFSSLKQINLEHVSIFGGGAFMFSGLTGTVVLSAENMIINSQAFRYCHNVTDVKIYARTCEIKSSYAFTEMDALKTFFVSDDTQLTISGKIMSYCPSVEAFVAPATTTVSYTKDDLFASCPNLVIYTPEESGLRAYAKQQFLRCAPAQYQEMSALLNTDGQ